MKLCTKLSDRVLDLEKTKTAQAKEIANLKKKVTKLERKRRYKTLGMNLFKIGTSRRRNLGKEDASKQERSLKQSIRAERNTTNQSSKEESNMNLSDLSSHSTRREDCWELVMVSTAAKFNAASEYGYYCLKSMFEEKLQLLDNADIDAD
nr:hypothetical protein [Tanacetum cinerariifolium]